jgi:hypothetical protein
LRIISWICDIPVKPYRKMAQVLGKSAQDHGYEFSLYPATQKEVGICSVRVGTQKKLFITCAGRPAFLKRVLDERPEDIVWMDLDCVIVKPLGDVLADCDVAFTIRKIEERNTPKLELFKYINCGVMFFKNNEATRRFIDLWQEETGDLYSRSIGGDDQSALNRFLLKHSKLDTYGEIFEIDGIRVKILDARIYNFFYFPENPNGAKVLHYKGFRFNDMDIYKEGA